MATLALALLLMGCQGVSGERVDLLTGVDANGCYAGGEGGPTAPLTVDAKYGTSFGGKPMMWPDGYTARRAGAEVVVLNSSGKVVATTRRLYHISAGVVSSPERRQLVQSLGAYTAASNCNYPWDFIDCRTPDSPKAPSNEVAQWCYYSAP
jgi:hypothetical protein